ncbi:MULTISPECIES: alpha/beta hydrolase [Paenibacillus]|uniref:alpha/beta hydrolase n=1 Tax=Paenibacillus TaxID=44249 RepID=UPI0022B93DFC|nr:alpha/beta hydrolase-fold protein [Paenibacillus caseinilyticus]MCZ8519001.1 alpha/beta hydrolase-fold protein [Paenibacillus caseinilyticus]
MDENLYLKRTIVKELVPSAFLDAPRPLRIYLPPGYNELLSYPVVYCQDGEDFFNFGRIATTMNRLIYDDNVEPAIIVGVDVDKSVRTAEYAPEGDRFAAYCRFFAEELLPFVEERYPVRSSADDRILAGDSLGGTVSLHLALDYRSLFYRVLSLSGAFLEGTRSRIEQEPDLSWLQIDMVIGTEETEVTTERGAFDFLEANRQAQGLLEARGAKLHYEEKPGRHVWGLWQQELPAMLKRMMD